MLGYISLSISISMYTYEKSVFSLGTAVWELGEGKGPFPPMVSAFFFFKTSSEM